MVVKRGLARAVPEDGPSSFWRDDLALQQLTSVPGGWWFARYLPYYAAAAAAAAEVTVTAGREGESNEERKK